MIKIGTPLAAGCVLACTSLRVEQPDMQTLFANIWTVAQSEITKRGGLPKVDGLPYMGENGFTQVPPPATCTTLTDYHVADLSDHWQCGTATAKNYLPDMSYNPEAEVNSALAKWASISESDLAGMNIQSGPTANPKQNGQWCGMPGPDNDVHQIWDTCVKQNGGYFNVATCNNDNHYGVIGIAAINSGVCYPAHGHSCTEAYWQIGGNSSWVSWEPGSTGDGKVIDSQTGKPPIYNPNRKAHEMRTGNEQFMLSVYWWVLNQNDKVENNYKWESQMKDSCAYQQSVKDKCWKV